MTQSQKEELKKSIKEHIEHIGEENEKLRAHLLIGDTHNISSFSLG